MQLLLVALVGVTIGLLLGVVIGARAGFLALRVAARVITAERRDPASSDVRLAS